MGGDSLVTAGILAVVALSEGIRVVPPGGLVLERPRGRWRIARTFELGSGMHVVSWCIPYTLPAVLPGVDVTGKEARSRAAELPGRLAGVQRHVTALRALGAVVLVVLVAGLPYSASHWSGFGLLGALALLILLCIAQSSITRRALAALGERPGAAWRFLWPFSAPRAPQFVQERAMAGVPPLLAAHLLLAADDLLREMRPFVYDVVSHREAAEAPELLTLYKRAELERFIATPLETDAQPYCPRCASIYRAGTASCADCEGVALTTP